MSTISFAYLILGDFFFPCMFPLIYAGVTVLFFETLEHTISFVFGAHPSLKGVVHIP